MNYDEHPFATARRNNPIGDDTRRESVLDRLARGKTDPLVGLDPSDILKVARKIRRQKIPKPKIQDPAVEGDLSWTGIAEKFNTAGEYAYNGAFGWLKWTGSRWEPIEETGVTKAIIEWATRRLSQAITDRNTTDEKVYFSIRHTHAPNVLSNLRAISFVPVSRFADPPWLLNCPNGVVDLRTGVLSPHLRNYSLHQTLAAYDPSTDMSAWAKFVSDVLPDPEMAHFVQVLAGYAVTGCVREQMFAIMFGSGKNGKSTLCNIISSVIGDYSGEIPTSSLAVKKHQGDNSPHLARQVGKRLLFANEPPEGMLLDDSTVKSLASRDKIAVCAKFKDPFDITPTWLLVVRCNNKPNIRATDDGIWRRVREIPFAVQFSNPDKTIEERIIRDHSSAVLRWLVEGAMEYAATGLPSCTAVDQAGATYRKEQDSVEGWYDACVISDPKASTLLSVLATSYTGWCQANSAYEYPLRRVSALLEKRGIKKISGTRLVTFIGVRV